MLGAIVLPDIALIHFLVHIATQGTEIAQPVIFQRPGEFPDHYAEGFRSFWNALYAAASAALAALVLVLMATSRARHRRLQMLSVGCLIALLGFAAGYCVWYFRFELPRISPYMAAVGIGSNLVERVAGGVLATIAVTVAAYRLATVDSPRFPVEPSSSKLNHQIAIHESTACPLVIGLAAATYFRESLNMFGGWPWSYTALWILQDPCALLMLTTLVLSTQLCWLHWKRPDGADWSITAIDRKKFLWYCMAVVAVASVGILTLSAFVFSFWLGP